MREIIIQSKKYGKFTVQIDDIDYEKASLRNWHIHKMARKKTVYAISNTVGFLHRFLLNPDKGVQVDHIDRNGLNCQRSNLRICNNAQNQWNKPASGYSFDSCMSRIKRYKSSIMVNGKKISLGYFKTEAEAMAAYQNATKIYHGQFACAL